MDKYWFGLFVMIWSTIIELFINMYRKNYGIYILIARFFFGIQNRFMNYAFKLPPFSVIREFSESLGQRQAKLLFLSQTWPIDTCRCASSWHGRWEFICRFVSECTWCWMIAFTFNWIQSIDHNISNFKILVGRETCFLLQFKQTYGFIAIVHTENIQSSSAEFQKQTVILSTKDRTICVFAFIYEHLQATIPTKHAYRKMFPS